MAIQQDVNINVRANTTASEQQISSLETKVRTLDGAINLVGGSIAALAGGLALSGAVTEEQAERFETAAIGAIALAEGAKRALDGFKTLAENTNILATAQKALNVVLKANPLVLLASAAAAATVAFIAFNASQRDSKTSAERATEAYENQSEALKALNEEQKFALELLGAQGATQEAVLEQQVKNAEETLQLQKENLATQRTINQFSEETKQAVKDVETAENNLLIAETKLATFRKNEAKDAYETQNNFVEESVQLKSKEIGQVTGQIDANLKLIDSTVVTQRTLTEIERNELIKRNQLRENNAQLAIATLDTIQAAAGVAFENNKAIASANVLVDAGQAALGILNTSYKNVDPTLVIAYQVAQFALLAATTVRSLQQINSANPDTGGGSGATNYGAPNAGGAGLSGPGFALGAPQVGDTSGVTTLNAIVLAGDVTSAQAQDAAIRNRRRFG